MSVWIMFIIGTCLAALVGFAVGYRSCETDRDEETKQSITSSGLLWDVDFMTYVTKQRNWSERTFGVAAYTDHERLTAHIKKELAEIQRSPCDCEEWIDVIILAIEGAWRMGHSPMTIASTLQLKQEKNFARQWVIPTDPTLPIEHNRYDERETNP